MHVALPVILQPLGNEVVLLRTHTRQVVCQLGGNLDPARNQVVLLLIRLLEVTRDFGEARFASTCGPLMQGFVTNSSFAGLK